MFKSKEIPKYKIDLVQEHGSFDILYGLGVWDDYLKNYNIRFHFKTEREAYEFIEKLEQYPKYASE